MKKICFVAFGAFPILKQEISFYDVGGAELQQVLIGKELVKRGYDVSFIDFDYGQARIENIENIKIIKTFMPKHKTKLFEYVVNSIKIYKALKIADADIYYQRAGIYFIPWVYCRINHKKFSYAIASDSLVERNKIDNYNIKKILKRKDIAINIANADIIIAQTAYQKDKIKENFGKDAILIKNVYSIKPQKPKSTQPFILWVATIKMLKQPEIFIKLAKKFPEVTFCMIGGPAENIEYYEKIKKEASTVPNLEFLGFVPLHKIDRYFKNAWIFVNTSTREGFPNTFLQAWANYTPVVSLNVDPDEIICKHRLGFHSMTFEQMVKDIEILLENKTLREEMGMNGRRYVEQEHNIKNIVEKYTGVVEKLLKSTTSGWSYRAFKRRNS